MLITVTARHCEIAEELRLRATQVLDRLAHHASRAVDGTVVFDMVDHKSTTARHTAANLATIRTSIASTASNAAATATDHAARARVAE